MTSAGPSGLYGLARLLALLRAGAAKLDAATELPADVAEALRESGLPAICLPRALGGGGQPLVVLVQTVEQIARADAGTAWALFILGTSPWLVSRAEAALGRRIYDDPHRLVAGVLAPTGTAEPAGDHVRLSGRWTFASGCAASDMILLMARAGSDQRLFVVPRDAVTIAENWDGLGLGSSGSATVTADDVAIPRSDQIDLSAPPAWPEPDFALPFKATFAIAAAILLGVAREALDYLIELADAKRGTFARGKLADSASIQVLVSRLHGVLEAARSLLYERLEDVHQAFGGDRGTIRGQADLRIAIIHACDSALEVVDAVHRAAGGTAAHHGCRVSKLFRDAHTASQHYMFGDEMREVTGAVLLGRAPDLLRL